MLSTKVGGSLDMKIAIIPSPRAEILGVTRKKIIHFCEPMLIYIGRLIYILKIGEVRVVAFESWVVDLERDRIAEKIFEAKFVAWWFNNNIYDCRAFFLIWLLVADHHHLCAVVLIGTSPSSPLPLIKV
jgi:hypothetical protein